MNRLERLQSALREFVAERAWQPYHDPKNLAMAVASEAGELTAELRWVPQAEADAWCRELPQRQRVADEIADVALCLFMLADRIELDLLDAMERKLAKNALKYPADEVRGRFE